MASRVSQQVVEVLTTTTPAGRVTQQVVEVLTLPAPAVQLSQVVEEVLRTGTAVPAALSQAVLEVLRVSGAEVPIEAAAQLSQVVLEVLRAGEPPATAAQLSQVVLEVLVRETQAQLSQVVAEILWTGTAVPAELSQVVLELLRANGAETALPGETQALLSQVVLEVLRRESIPSAVALLTQHVLEVLGTAVPGARLTQHTLEVLGTSVPRAQLTQHVLEVLGTSVPRAQLTQHVLEVLWTPTPRVIPYFHDALLDQYLSYGCKVKVKFQTFITRMRQGHEERIGEWQDPIWTFDITPALRDQADLDYLIAFFRARNGPEFIFKFFNPLDFQATTELFGVGDGQTTEFQLSRHYATGLPGDGLYYVRPITLPVAGVQIFQDGVGLSDSLWILQPLGGSVVFTAPPPAGTQLTWTGAYFTPVRFQTNRVYSVVEHYEHFEDQIVLTEKRLGIFGKILTETESPDFVEVQFPVLYAQRATMGPELDTVTITSDSGGTARTIQFTDAKIRFTVEETEQPQAVIQSLMAFFLNRKGRLYGFRARDITDFELASETMQPGDGVKTEFQLVKNYLSGAQNKVRTITKPASDMVISVGGVPADSQPTLDLGTGKVIFASPPSAGVVITCTGTFDVPVRFDSDEIIFSIQGFEAFNLEAIGLLEMEFGLPEFTIEALAT